MTADILELLDERQEMMFAAATVFSALVGFAAAAVAARAFEVERILPCDQHCWAACDSFANPMFRRRVTFGNLKIRPRTHGTDILYR